MHSATACASSCSEARALAEARQAGRTVFLSSHNLVEVERACDEVAIIREGEIITTEDIKTLRRNNYKKIMITGDEKRAVEKGHEFETVQADNIVTARGFGFIDNAIIDQHFNQRTGQKARFSRIVRMHADQREDLDEASAGDIVAVAGIPDVGIGDTLADPENPQALPPIKDAPAPTISKKASASGLGCSPGSSVGLSVISVIAHFSETPRGALRAANVFAVSFRLQAEQREK